MAKWAWVDNGLIDLTQVVRVFKYLDTGRSDPDDPAGGTLRCVRISFADGKDIVLTGKHGTHFYDLFTRGLEDVVEDYRLPTPDSNPQAP